VQPPAISTREQHLAAALDAWDRLPAAESVAGAAAGATSIDTAPARSSRRRRRRVAPAWGSWALGAAAAVVVVAGAGLAVRNLDLGGDDQVETAFDAVAPSDDGAAQSEVEANAEQAAEELTVATETPAAADADDIAAAEMAPADEAVTADAAGSAADVDETRGDASDVGEGDVSIEGSPVGDGESSVEEPPPAETDEQPIETIEELVDLAVDAQSARRSAASATGVATTISSDLPLCTDELGIDFLVAPVAFRGRAALVGIDDDTNRVIAYTEDCVAVVRRPLPDPDDG
jgi:hypothetical protein